MEPEIKDRAHKDDDSSGSDEEKTNEISLRRRNKNGNEQQSLGPQSFGDSPKTTVTNKLKRKKKKDENLACSKFIAFLMVSPTIIYFFSVVYDIIARYTVSGKLIHFGALILGFALSGALCVLLYKPLKPFIKYMGVASLCVFFIPSIQVFNCSPVTLENSRLGTLIRLKEGVDGFMKTAYQNSSCWKDQYFKTPFEFSIYSPSFKIIVKPYQVINLGMQHYDQKEDTFDGPPPEVLPYTLYLLTSQRSVKRQIYYLNLLTMVAGKSRGIADVLEMSVDDRENVTLHLTGSIRRMGEEFNETKVELEEMQYLVRPLLFHVYNVEVYGMPEKDEDGEGSKKERKGQRKGYKEKQKHDDNESTQDDD